MTMPWLTPGSNGAGGQLLLIRVDEWRQAFSKRHPSQTGYSLIDGTVFGRRRAPTAARVAFSSAARRRKKFVHSARPQGRRSNSRSAARPLEMSRSDM
jgi:hypothetical protein